MSGKKSFALRKKTFYHSENSEKSELGTALRSNFKVFDFAGFRGFRCLKLAISATLPVSSKITSRVGVNLKQSFKAASKLGLA